jgi:hypothetical protein
LLQMCRMPSGKDAYRDERLRLGSGSPWVFTGLALAGQEELCSTHSCTQWQQFLALDGYLRRIIYIVTLIWPCVLVTIDGVWIGE